jgi:WhiB family transcriptional regulator, redox-sensing transcriptional regulator
MIASPGRLLQIVVDVAELKWADYAICQETDPELFFPEKGESTRAAKRICQDCPVRLECLDYALEHEERFGIFGGMSERERRNLNRSRSAA